MGILRGEFGLRRPQESLVRGHKARKRLLVGLVLVATLLAGRATEALARNATPEDFAQPDQTLEYHLLINSNVNLSQQQLDKALPAYILDRFAPLLSIGPAAKPKAGMYVDSPDRILMQQSLILRVEEGLITFKSRGSSPEMVVDLAKCHGKKHEMDFYGLPEYSVSTDLRFTRGEFDAGFAGITLQKLYTFVETKCSAAFLPYMPLLRDNPSIRIPGAVTMFDYKARLNHPLAAKVKAAVVSAWFFPPTREKLLELSFRGYVRDRADLDRLSGELLGFLRGRGLLDPRQMSKTDYYFKAFFGRNEP